MDYLGFERIAIRSRVSQFFDLEEESKADSGGELDRIFSNRGDHVLKAFNTEVEKLNQTTAGFLEELDSKAGTGDGGVS